MDINEEVLKNYKTILRLSEYPAKSILTSDPSMAEGIWSSERRLNIRLFGPKGEAITENRLAEALQKANTKIYERDIKFIVDTSLYIINDVMRLRQIKDDDMVRQIIIIKPDYRNEDASYNENMIDTAFALLMEFIEKYEFIVLDDIAFEKFVEVQKEIYDFFYRIKNKSSCCKILKSRYLKEIYSKYDLGPNMCELCNM